MPTRDDGHGIDVSRYKGHTPGPWHYGVLDPDITNKFEVYGAGPKVRSVADVVHHKVDARLIADAPKLLVAIRELRDALQALYDEQNGPPLVREAENWKAVMDEAEKMLAKYREGEKGPRDLAHEEQSVKQEDTDE